VKLQNKVALVTGSTSGIGAAVAQLFAREGANVIIHGSEKSRAAGAEIVSEIRALGSDAIHIVADLTRPDEIKSMFAQIREKYGHLDILINNVGFGSNDYTIEDATNESIDYDMHLNFNQVVLCTQSAVKLMNGRDGWIVNTSSMRGIDYAFASGVWGYSAAKAALNSFTKRAAAQFAKQNIFVNAVVPGMVGTDALKQRFASFTKEKADSKYAAIPIGRLIEPAEIAEVFLLLATSKIFCGSLVVADGGYTMLNR